MDEDTIERVLRDMRVVAVVGLSDKPWRPSHGVAEALQSRGIRIVPVNPTLAGSVILGERVYASLLDIPRDIRIDVIDVFRRSELVPPIVDDAIARADARAVWMQQGVVNEEAAARARDAGMEVVMDACLAVEHRARLR